MYHKKLIRDILSAVQAYLSGVETGTLETNGFLDKPAFFLRKILRLGSKALLEKLISAT